MVSMGKEVAIKALVYRPTTNTSATDEELLALCNSTEVQVDQTRSLKCKFALTATKISHTEYSFIQKAMQKNEA